MNSKIQNTKHQMPNTSKGITLVALVITIIVLLILAGVAINMAINSDGLFGKANEAAEKWNTAVADESDAIDNLLAQIGVINWEKAKAEAVAPASQDEERNNGVIGIGTDGKPVDMDLWLYAMDNKTGGYGLNSAEVLNNEENGGTNTERITMTGYVGTISENGEIEGTIPAYIKVADGEWNAVTSLYKTFQGNATNSEQIANLTVAPVLPETVKNMMGTFINSKIKGMPEIPQKVEDMTSTFYGCTKLEGTTKIPSSVRMMDYTFQGCANLKKTPEILEGITKMLCTFSNCSNLIEVRNIPNSVVNMNQTFQNCTSLQSIRKLPDNVEALGYTFDGCTALINGPTVIPASVKDMRGTFMNCTNLQGTMEINANIQEESKIGEVSAYAYCFTGATTASGITLKIFGSCQALEAIASVTGAGNVILDTEQVTE